MEHLASQAADHLTVVGCAAQVAESATLTKLDLSDNGIEPIASAQAYEKPGFFRIGSVHESVDATTPHVCVCAVLCEHRRRPISFFCTV